eukprot:7557865-Pyramimonas_sp.AAC.1
MTWRHHMICTSRRRGVARARRHRSQFRCYAGAHDIRWERRRPRWRRCAVRRLLRQAAPMLP